MCSEYILKSKKKLLEETLGHSLMSEESSWDLHVRLFGKAPVIFADSDRHLQVKEMSFSLKPSGTSYPTFNARLSGWDDRRKRIVKISERNTWKEPLAERRCVVPMTGFIEPMYLGPHAGHAMEFESLQEPLLLAAGIYENSIDEKTGEPYEGFSLILHTPSEYILKMGHHRQVVLLSPRDALRWIAPGRKSPEAAYNFLLKHRAQPELRADEVRPLSKNWEKKIPEYREKLEKERQYMEIIHESHQF